MKHVVERTSPKGQDFIGVCRLCGKTGLPMTAALEECENIRGLTYREAFAETITGETQGEGER